VAWAAAKTQDMASTAKKCCQSCKNMDAFCLESQELCGPTRSQKVVVDRPLATWQFSTQVEGRPQLGIHIRISLVGGHDAR
jgi:hypothetical protein